MRRLYKIVLFVMVVTGSSLAQQLSEQLEDAKHKLEKDACDLQALSRLTTLLRGSLKSGLTPDGSKTLDELATYSTRGLTCLKAITSKSGSADQVKTNNELMVTFRGGAGYAALRNKQFPRAQRYLKGAVDADPNNLENVWLLAFSYLSRGYGSASPREVGAGLFYVARSASLSPEGSKARNDIERYLVKAYRNYHGSREGYDELLKIAKQYGAPPPGFIITKRLDSRAHE